MYLNSSIENGWTDLADSFFVVFVIAAAGFYERKF